MSIYSIFASELYLWFQSFLSSIPGRIGILARVTFYNILLKDSSLQSVGFGCSFTSPSNISIGKSHVGNCSDFIACPNSNIVIGNNTYFNSGVHLNSSIGGSIIIGDNCLVGPNFVARTSSHIYQRQIQAGNYSRP